MPPQMYTLIPYMENKINEKVEKEYTVNIIGAPYNAEVLYKGNRIENGTILTIDEINADHFEGNDIEG